MLSRGISSADGIGPAIQIVGDALQGDRGCFRHPESVLAVSELGDPGMGLHNRLDVAGPPL